MLELIYLVLALGLVVSILLITTGSGSSPVNSRLEEIASLLHVTEQEMDDVYDTYKTVIDDTMRRNRQ